jgi:hypothetical protein
LVGNCLVFVNWSLYGNESDYDYQSILAHKPIAFLTTIHKIRGGPGSAGSFRFHEFLQKTRVYIKLYSSCLYYPTSMSREPYDLRFEWYELPELRSPEPKLKRAWPCTVVHPVNQQLGI